MKMDPATSGPSETPTNLDDTVEVSVAQPPARFSRRVIFAPHLHGSNKSDEVFLVLDCGHWAEWSASKPVPHSHVCASCAAAGPTTLPTGAAPTSPARTPSKPPT